MTTPVLEPAETHGDVLAVVLLGAMLAGGHGVLHQVVTSYFEMHTRLALSLIYGISGVSLFGVVFGCVHMLRLRRRSAAWIAAVSICTGSVGMSWLYAYVTDPLGVSSGRSFSAFVESRRETGINRHVRRGGVERFRGNTLVAGWICEFSLFALAAWVAAETARARSGDAARPGSSRAADRSD